jgi:hypothetical protein
MPVERSLMLRALPPFCPDRDFGVPFQRQSAHIGTLPCVELRC